MASLGWEFGGVELAGWDSAFSRFFWPVCVLVLRFWSGLSGSFTAGRFLAKAAGCVGMRAFVSIFESRLFWWWYQHLPGQRSTYNLEGRPRAENQYVVFNLVKLAGHGIHSTILAV